MHRYRFGDGREPRLPIEVVRLIVRRMTMMMTTVCIAGMMSIVVIGGMKIVIAMVGYREEGEGRRERSRDCSMGRVHRQGVAVFVVIVFVVIVFVVVIVARPRAAVDAAVAVQFVFAVVREKGGEHPLAFEVRRAAAGVVAVTVIHR